MRSSLAEFLKPLAIGKASTDLTNPEPERSPLLVVLGPTGTGKSELGLVLAERFDGEIVGCDSVQVYRGLDIGSAKVRFDQRRAVEHHLIDVIGPNEYLTAGAYSRLAREAVSTIRAKGKLPIVVGGTGLYLRALLDGLSPAPARDEQLRARLDVISSRRPGALHRFLRQRDPEASIRIHPNDRQKLIRAVELILLARHSVTATQSSPRDSLKGVAPLKLGLAPDRKLLYERLDQRSTWMFSNGILTETQVLLDSGVSAGSKPLQSLGYKQALKVLTGLSSIEDAIYECQIKTRQYAKRQITWFRKEGGVHWLSGFGTQGTIQSEALERTGSFLTSLFAT